MFLVAYSVCVYSVYVYICVYMCIHIHTYIYIYYISKSAFNPRLIRVITIRERADWLQAFQTAR